MSARSGVVLFDVETFTFLFL